MERNAISAGFGSLVNSEEIKILICYILSSVTEPVNITKLASMFHAEEIANYFEVINAAAELEQAKNIRFCDNGEMAEVLPLGRDSAAEFENMLPYTIKTKAYRLTLKMLSRLRNARETECVYSTENGVNYLTCSAIDNGKTVMSVKIMVCDKTQAKSIEERFIDNPGRIYSDIIDIITGNFKDDEI